MKNFINSIWQHLKFEFKVDGFNGWTSILLIISFVIIIGAYAGIANFQERIEVVEWQDSKQDSVIQENQDSLSAFMSVIIEANTALVKRPKDCRNLVLVKIQQPCYATKKSKTEIEWTKPLNESVLIWIPTDLKSWVWCEPGKDLKDRSPLLIGGEYYNGDLNKISMEVVTKEDRGF